MRIGQGDDRRGDPDQGRPPLAGHPDRQHDRDRLDELDRRREEGRQDRDEGDRAHAGNRNGAGRSPRPVAFATRWYDALGCIRSQPSRSTQLSTPDPRAAMFAYNQTLVDDFRANSGKSTIGHFVGRQMMVLTTTGARTGGPRVTPLAYSVDDGKVVIVASMGGADRHPAWYLNLEANPIVTVEVGCREVPGPCPDREGRRARAALCPARRSPPFVPRLRHEDDPGHPGDRPRTPARGRPHPGLTPRAGGPNPAPETRVPLGVGEEELQLHRPVVGD